MEESGALSFLGVAEDFSYTLRTTKPNFKRDRFLAACGVEYVWDIGLQDQAFADDSHSSSSRAPLLVNPYAQRWASIGATLPKPKAENCPAEIQLRYAGPYIETRVYTIN